VDTEKTLHLHGEGGEWLGSYGATGTPARQVVWLGSQPVGLIQAGKLLYIESDHLGSPRVVVDPQRDVAVWRWSLLGEPFGSRIPAEDPDQDGILQFFDLRFPGQRMDSASGLSYNYFRDYEPSTGRYVQRDPIGLNGGGSTYGYVGADPGGSTDSYGLQRLRPTHVPNPGPIGGYDYYHDRYYSNGYRYSGFGGSDLDALAGAVGLAFRLSRPGEWADPNGFNRFLLGGLLTGAFGSTQESRAKSDPAVLKPVNPGRNCEGDCKPCPPGVRWYVNRPGHGHANGYWHTINYNQDPMSCMCYPDRPSGGLQGN
jgi:RHS repeat-associated protein